MNSFSFIARSMRSSRLLCPTNKLLTKDASASDTPIESMMNTTKSPALLCTRASAASECASTAMETAEAAHSVALHSATARSSLRLARTACIVAALKAALLLF